MKLKTVKSLLNTDTIFEASAEKDDLEVKNACGADLMSDVLAFSNEKTLLLTGLTNPQVVRTAEMVGIQVIIFVRGKEPQIETISLANQLNIFLYSTDKPLFEACGLLYKNGIGPEEMNFIETSK
ncbi:hypothetical protein ACTWKD_05890 [Halanaerobium saccharolyticum]|jgi:hypothetical protein|uniref:DRTGG domain-containing protein n=1 Tax=Halanaerobium saccharolyticum TaxID=43595 RepID=A0A4R6SPS2_9FIRM|nr:MULTISPECIES: hypothetical protein [Halanaerobium]PUU93986.1 MAG: hypothetical protein CI949_1076 [Halanaerobium sp.]PUU95427.1 MAG: hypothetical protein CI947_243 [Halanaerobium sp.]TDQ06054.1 hypothetical protein C7957_10189 [Halanaerobium saccharolyticum]